MSDLWTKAQVAARSARTLFEAGDTDGAINRAYYAMFDAARAALAAIDPDLPTAKRHATIIGRFGKHLVEERGFDRSLGRIFAQTEDARRAADYEEGQVDEPTARMIVSEMERFLEAVSQFLTKARP